MALNETAAHLTRAIAKRGQKMKRASLFVKIAFVAVFAAVAGICQFMQFPLTGPDTSQVIGIMASLVVAIGSIFVIWTDEDASEALALAAKAIEEARVAQDQWNLLPIIQADLDRLIELFQAMNVMRGLLEQATALPDLTEEKLISSMLDAAGRSLTIAMDFEQSELWTVGIYKAFPDADHPGKIVLCPIAHRRAINCDLSQARKWREGTGIMGVCYSSGDEIIVPDLQADGTRSVFGTSSNEFGLMTG